MMISTRKAVAHPGAAQPRTGIRFHIRRMKPSGVVSAILFKRAVERVFTALVNGTGRRFYAYRYLYTASVPSAGRTPADRQGAGPVRPCVSGVDVSGDVIQSTSTPGAELRKEKTRRCKVVAMRRRRGCWLLGSNAGA